MAYQRTFDEEIARTAALACINDGMVSQNGSYGVPLSTTTASVDDVAPGIYRAFIAGMDPSLVVALTITASAETVTPPTVTLPASPTTAPVAIFPGSVVERIRVLAGFQSINALLVSGTATLYLVPIVQG